MRGLSVELRGGPAILTEMASDPNPAPANNVWRMNVDIPLALDEKLRDELFDQMAGFAMHPRYQLPPVPGVEPFFLDPMVYAKEMYDPIYDPEL